MPTAPYNSLRTKHAPFLLIGSFASSPPGRTPLGACRLIGAVEAGFPSPAEEELVDTLSLDEMLITNREASFLLKVAGDSMTGAGIMPEDLVIVERGRTPKSGDIVIAEVDGQWTMKYLRKRGERVILVPSNPKYQTITPKNELKIAGVVTAVVRKYK